MNILKRLFELRDTEYQKLQSKIIPNIPADTIIGVRVPKLRELAKELNTDPVKEDFMKTLPHQYYEENQLHIMLACMEKDYEKCIKELDRFLPYADNWAITDQPTPRSFKNKHRELLPVITKWLESDHVYIARYGINIFMREYLDEDFDTDYSDMIASKRGEDYYLKMMIAWYFATALAKQYDKIVPYLQEHKLDDWTHNKTIQKAVESYRITDEQKTYLKTLRIKRKKL